MAFLSKLIVDGVEYNVITAEYEINKPADGSGLPAGRSQAGKISAVIESNKNTDLIDWAVSDSILKKGELTLYNRDSLSTFRKIEFSEAYCIKFKEKFNSIDNQPVIIELTLAARVIKYKDVNYTNQWPKNN